VDVDNVRQRVTVKLIPRIDLQALANKLVCAFLLVNFCSECHRAEVFKELLSLSVLIMAFFCYIGREGSSKEKSIHSSPTFYEHR